MLIFMSDANLGGPLGRLITPDGLYMIIGKEPYRIFNMSSIYNLGTGLSNLVPKVNFDGTHMNINDSREFDIYYANYLVRHVPAFIDMVSIMYEIYLTGNAIVLVGTNEYKFQLSESFMKFLQQRYEYPIHIVEDVDDIPDYMVDDYHFTSVLGLSHFDYDREMYNRYTIDAEEVKAQYKAILRGEDSNGQQ